MPSHKEAILNVINILTHGDDKVINSIDDIQAIGHRVVHGGEFFDKSVIVDEDVIAKLESIIPLAPLHNPANIMGMKITRELMPTKPNVAVFDTAFHQTMPASSFMYAIPYEDYKDFGIRKYGFHGTSHYYVSNEAQKLLNKEESKIIVCHLGNGSSVCAVKDGKSVETSMGLTPLEGLIMGTRSGDLDPTVVTFLMEKKGMTGDEVNNYLNKKSGLLGVSGISSDLREVIEEAEEGNERAICFTAGIGENANLVREKVCENLEFMGIKLDDEKNAIRSGEAREINSDDSKVKIYVIPTNEEYVIAHDTYELVKG
jgi:acetate kinase